MNKNTRKKIRDFNLFRFCVSVLIITILLVGTGMIGFAVLADKNTNDDEFIMKNMYQTYCITRGDTLWSIAKTVNLDVYNNKKDIRKIINNIKKINNLHSENILIGEIIYLPKI